MKENSLFNNKEGDGATQVMPLLTEDFVYKGVLDSEVNYNIFDKVTSHEII